MVTTVANVAEEAVVEGLSSLLEQVAAATSCFRVSPAANLVRQILMPK